MKQKIILGLLVLFIVAIIFISGCAQKVQIPSETTSQAKGANITYEPAPKWIEEKAQNYLESKLGIEYVNKYILLKSSVLQSFPKKYIVTFDYNFPYEGDKQFRVIIPFEGDWIEGGPAIPHSFDVSEDEAIGIAKNVGMGKVDGVRFVFKNTIIIEHDPPNPESKNMLALNENKGDYVLEIYVNERKKGEISNVYITSSDGKVIGFYISPDNYKPGDEVSVPGSQPKPEDSVCDWESGSCKNICQSQNYFFNKNTKQCEKYVESIGGGCCTPPPFETLEECQKLCK